MAILLAFRGRFGYARYLRYRRYFFKKIVQKHRNFRPILHHLTFLLFIGADAVAQKTCARRKISPECLPVGKNRSHVFVDACVVAISLPLRNCASRQSLKPYFFIMFADNLNVCLIGKYLQQIFAHCFVCKEGLKIF